ncbi:MAG: hypothetical protein HY782_15705 [Chloroflexi bacterium]|nr:hypothetical protein [Chloroflexota bacterium]
MARQKRITPTRVHLKRPTSGSKSAGATRPRSASARARAATTRARRTSGK